MTRAAWPIIVGGCHRSGTSLLRRLLNAHSRIHCGPEVKFFRDAYGDYPTDPVGHLRFFATARAIAPEDELLTIMGGAFVRLHERAAERAGKPRWADKSPENVVYLADWQRLLGDRWLFVHVVRNPLDTLASIKETPFPRTIPPDLDGRIAFYQRYARAGLEFAAAYPDRYFRLRYEALVVAPERTLGRLMRWLGEAYERGQLAFNDRLHEPGLEDPKIARTSGIHVKSVERWARVLTHEEARVIKGETHELWALLARSESAGSGEERRCSPR